MWRVSIHWPVHAIGPFTMLSVGVSMTPVNQTETNRAEILESQPKTGWPHSAEG